MTFKTLMLAATLAAFAATGAVAQDAMKKDDAMASHDAMKADDKMAPHDAMAHDAMGKKMTPAEKKKHDAMMKKDAMAKHDAMKSSTPQ